MSSIFGFRSGQASVRLDIDHDSRLKNGSIEYFSPLKDGGVLALVRTVAQYNTIDGASTTPKLYADTFSVIFDPVGTVSNITQLRIPSSAQVTGLGHLKNGWLVAGYTHDSTFITVLAYLLDEAGNLIKDIPLPNSRGTSSRTGHAESVGVFRPTVLPTAEGDLLLLRGFSNQPIYRFSETGQLLLTTKLQPDGIDFWSPLLVGSQLFVKADVFPEKPIDNGEIPVVRFRSLFPVFDLRTGEITEVRTWMDYGTVACFMGAEILVFQEPRTVNGLSWKMLTLKPVSHTSRTPKS